MCCRYYYDLDGIQNDIVELKAGMSRPERLPAGEIRPGGSSVMIAGRQGLLRVDPALWGFPAKERGLVINARAESVLSRPMFSSSALSRRCVIPAMSFCEWDASKQLVRFTDPARRLMFLAGIWSVFEDESRFVVMTTEANGSVSPVHDRMPLLIDRQDVGRWILDDRSFERLLSRPMPELETYREQEQLSLF